MADLDTREWLLTNGLGSFASGTGSDARTHWLMRRLIPCRTLLLSHLDASLEVAGLVVALGTNFWGSGRLSRHFKLLRSLRLSRFPPGFGVRTTGS